MAFVLIKIGLAAGWFMPPDSVTFEHLVARLTDTGGRFAGEMLSIFLTLNVLLCAFNLIPLPPLDGASVIGLFVPESAAVQNARAQSHPDVSDGGPARPSIWPVFGRPRAVLRLVLVIVDHVYGYSCVCNVHGKSRSTPSSELERTIA